MDELRVKIEKALDSIRPYLEVDGGNIKILEIDEDKNVVLELLGNCGMCPMSTMTMKMGVEEAIKKSVPDIKSIHAINITSPQDPNARFPK